MNSVNGSGFSAKPARFWQVAILTAAGAIGTASQADAAFYCWTDYSDGSYGRQERHLDVPRQKPQKRGAVGKKDLVAGGGAGAGPRGPRGGGGAGGGGGRGRGGPARGAGGRAAAGAARERVDLAV